VVRQGDTLVMRQPFGVEWPLSPSFADGFTTRLRGVTTFVFTRSADGRSPASAPGRTARAISPSPGSER
jgi:hypothetical protein